MPKDKDFKRKVRARMEKTGEAYTSARARLLARQASGPREDAEEAAPTPSAADLAGMSDEAVRAKTGRDWKEWTALLDDLGAAEMEHPEIARHLAEEHGLPGWWAQTVTVGYERIRGLRAPGQRRDGTWDANRSRTLPVAVEDLWEAIADPERRRRWLPEEGFEVTSESAGKSLRLRWKDGSRVHFHLTAKGPEKSAVAIQHRKLASREEVERRKGFWGERLDALAELVG